MGKIICSFLFVLISSSSLCAKVNYFEQPIADQTIYDLSSRWHILEREYEDNSSVIDEREYSSLLNRFAMTKSIVSSLSYGGAVNVEVFGTQKKSFLQPGPLTSGELKYRGVRSLELYSQYLNLNRNIAFKIHLEGTLQDGRERNASLGGYNGSFTFKYLHELGALKIGGKIFSAVVGKKRIYRQDGEREISDPYNQFGKELSVLYEFERITLSLSGHFLLATDYVIRSPSYTRSSDKGFGVGGKLSATYHFKQSDLTLWHDRANQVFNVITVDPNLQHEYEIEEQSSGVGFRWYY
ncbi:MAG: hypothetical protein CME71_04870 [Halobacteriovorax sp.]|nr:hypothetical protein [Halobacteriovorax sp.]|tara:strand:- start:341 stop:1228 length:888 start_codon:yes stop_codon:yes gene_type:complete